MKIAMEASTPPPDASDEVLVDPGWLQAHLSDPRVRVVEVDVSTAAYNDWHIDGAVLWNIYADLKDADYRLASQRCSPRRTGHRRWSHSFRLSWRRPAARSRAGSRVAPARTPSFRQPCGNVAAMTPS